MIFQCQLQSAKISIIGTGYVGFTTAFTLARAEALDIAHGTCSETPVKIVGGDYAETKNSDIVIFTAEIWPKVGKTRLDLLHIKILSTSSSVINIPAKNVSDFVMDIEKTICSRIGDADVKVWISFDTKAHMLVVSASGQAGIEILFHCCDEIRQDYRRFREGKHVIFYRLIEKTLDTIHIPSKNIDPEKH